MSVRVLQDVTFVRTFRLVPRAELSAVLAVRNRIVADAPNLPSTTDALFEEGVAGVYYARHVPLTPWVVVYAWNITTRTVVLRAVRAPDPPF